MFLGAEQKRLVCEVLLDVFSEEDELNNLVTFTLERPLAHIVKSHSTLSSAVLQVVEFARARDKIDLLLLAVQDFAPGNSAVHRALQALAIDEGAGDLEKKLFAQITIADPEAWRSSMVKCERSVCRVDTSHGEGVGTGFLISADKVVTNWHVLDEVSRRGLAPQCRFDYHRDAKLNCISEGAVYSLSSKSPVEISDEKLDFALLCLSKPAGAEPVGGLASAPIRGFLKPAPHSFVQGEPISIIQHPLAEYRKFAFGSVCEPSLNGSRVGYKVDTEPGSSGAPCFTHDWRPVAIHYYGAEREGFNRGIDFAAVLGKYTL